jgi:cysteine desulfurase family protein
MAMINRNISSDNGEKMIYFDNAATSYPKPKEVKEEVIYVMDHCGANPGRGGYEFAKRTSQYMEEARKEIADFLNIIPSKNLLFTSGATEGANIVLKSCLSKGEHLLYTGAEHNATSRPVKWLETAGIKTTKVPVSGNKITDLRAFERLIQNNTRLFVVNHGSNVFGYIQPLTEIIALAKRYGILVFADMAQTAGFLDYDIAASGIDFACFAGHKSLMGYGGVGLLYVRDPYLLKPLIYGGTGSMSHLLNQPPVLPSGFEAGTHNLIGIGSLLGGVRYLKKQTIAAVREHERELSNQFLSGVKNMSHITIYDMAKDEERLPVVSLNIKDHAPGDVAGQLEKRAGICVRAGLHCSPTAHETIGTLATGTVRFSFGAFNSKLEVDAALNVLFSMK